MPILVCYDIQKNGLRNKVANLLQQYGLERINLSVWMGSPDKRELAELNEKLTEVFERKCQENDSIIVLPITNQQIYRMQVMGLNKLKPRELTGDEHTLIF
jgi:CRISPR-associated protein Cas2